MSEKYQKPEAPKDLELSLIGRASRLNSTGYSPKYIDHTTHLIQGFYDAGFGDMVHKIIGNYEVETGEKPTKLEIISAIDWAVTHATKHLHLEEAY
jgi:hypothetical protein